MNENPTTNPTPLERAKEKAARKLLEVMANREEILTAFIAKYGCEPDEIEQVLENDYQGHLHFYVKKRTKIISLVN